MWFEAPTLQLPHRDSSMAPKALPSWSTMPYVDYLVSLGLKMVEPSPCTPSDPPWSSGSLLQLWVQPCLQDSNLHRTWYMNDGAPRHTPNDTTAYVHTLFDVWGATAMTSTYWTSSCWECWASVYAENLTTLTQLRLNVFNKCNSHIFTSATQGGWLRALSWEL